MNNPIQSLQSDDEFSDEGCLRVVELYKTRVFVLTDTDDSG